MMAHKLSLRNLSLHDVPGLKSQGGYDVGIGDDGDYSVYKRVNFPANITTANVRVASAGSGGTLEFRLDGPTGQMIGSVSIPVTGGAKVDDGIWGSIRGNRPA
jgi:hypothetical protein